MAGGFCVVFVAQICGEKMSKLRLNDLLESEICYQNVKTFYQYLNSRFFSKN